MRRLTTTARTGRRMKRSVNLIPLTAAYRKSLRRPVPRSQLHGQNRSQSLRGRGCRGLRRRIAADDDRRAVLQLDLAGGDDLVAGLYSRQDRDVVGPARPGLDRSAEGLELRLAVGILP